MVGIHPLLGRKRTVSNYSSSIDTYSIISVYSIIGNRICIYFTTRHRKRFACVDSIIESINIYFCIISGNSHLIFRFYTFAALTLTKNMHPYITTCHKHNTITLNTFRRSMCISVCLMYHIVSCNIHREQPARNLHQTIAIYTLSGIAAVAKPYIAVAHIKIEFALYTCTRSIIVLFSRIYSITACCDI